ncbi:hypothetical protein [Phage DSL-LC06]|nr:hypothetical protein [Phage DSL-LC06]
MAWGTSSNVTTVNLSSGASSPAAARVELKAALDELVLVIDGRNQANGVAGLNASSKISAAQLPDELVSSAATDLTLNPTTDKVKIQHILNLTPQTTAQLQARTDVLEGDIAVASDGDSGVLCLAIASGETDSAGAPIWRRISLGSEISST